MGPCRLRVFCAVFCVIFADGRLRSAVARCAPNDKIFIDPKLVPSRPRISQEAYERMMSSTSLGRNQKAFATQLYLQQSQPIEIPFGNGILLVNPKNPCIQRYVGR
jgi:hypothetical protein